MRIERKVGGTLVGIYLTPQELRDAYLEYQQGDDMEDVEFLTDETEICSTYGINETDYCKIFEQIVRRKRELQDDGMSWDNAVHEAVDLICKDYVDKHGKTVEDVFV